MSFFTPSEMSDQYLQIRIRWREEPKSVFSGLSRCTGCTTFVFQQSFALRFHRPHEYSHVEAGHASRETVYAAACNKGGRRNVKVG
jgi:hypothetical protein